MPADSRQAARDRVAGTVRLTMAQALIKYLMAQETEIGGEELKKFNYEGWLVVEAEQDPAIADPFTFAVAGYKHLKNVVTTAGLV